MKHRILGRLSRVLYGLGIAACLAGALLSLKFQPASAGITAGEGNCGTGYVYKDELGPTFSYSGNQIITSVFVKAGSDKPGDYEACTELTMAVPSSVCYAATGLGTTSVSVTKINSSCKDISHVEFYAGTVPTEEPTAEPTQEPTAEPTQEPTAEPTQEPTAEPTQEPTQEPTAEPTIEPTQPTQEPTAPPGEEPTEQPTVEPTVDPTVDPTIDPTTDPTVDPTQNPTETETPPAEEPVDTSTPDPGTATPDPGTGTPDPGTTATPDPGTNPPPQATTPATVQPPVVPAGTTVPPVLVPVTGIDLSESGLNGSDLLINFGIALFGLGLVVQGIAGKLRG